MVSESTISHELETLVSIKKKYSSGNCTSSKAGVFYRSLSCCYSNSRAWFCNPLFKHQSKGGESWPGKNVIRSCDKVKKIPLSMKRTLFSTHSTRWASLSALLHIRWGTFFSKSPHTAYTTFSACIAAREEENPSLTETATYWIVLHYLRDSQEIFNKYITHCIKINIIYKTFIVFCLSTSYSVYKRTRYRWDLQRFVWIFPLMRSPTYSNHCMICR